MKKLTSTRLASALAVGAVGALTLAATDADAQGRAMGGRSASSGARSHTSSVRGPAAGVRGHVTGVRSHPVSRGARVGVVVGAPFVASPWWYYPYPYPHYYGYGYDPYYHPPAVYVQEQPTVYLEQQAPPPASALQAEPYWYYCQDSKTYYPYVQTCATPWQRVIPYPPKSP